MTHSKPRLFTRASVRRAALLLAASVLPTAHAADVDEAQTAITGTENIDDLAISTAQNASVAATNVEGATTSATATGVDALEGNDHISGNAAITAEAEASAAIVAMPKPGEVNATATGVSAGDGDDLVEGSLAITSTASASGAYAGAIDWSVQNPTQPPEKKIEAGVTTNATATGIATGEGDDTASNDAAMNILADATSGGGAAPLSAETNESTEVKSTSTANATATAFETGAGSDHVTNDGDVINAATATSGALSVSLVAPKGGATDPKPGATQIKTEASATANATAVGINADSEESEDVDEDTRDFSTGGLRYTLTRSTTAVAGDDTVSNHAALNNSATATAGAGGATISNKVDGTLSATATADATADSTGIVAGGGNDHVTNDGYLTTRSTASAGALSVSLDVGPPRADGPAPAPGTTPTPQEPSTDRESKTASNTSVAATATATGINTEAGASETLTRLAEITTRSVLLDEHQTTTAAASDDVVVNDGDMESWADATVDSLNAAVTLSAGGSASVDSQSTATAETTGITTGAGNDAVTNAGNLLSFATSDARAATLALAAGNANAPAPSAGQTAPTVAVSANTSVNASSTAMGIDAEGAAQSTDSTRHLSIDSDGLQAHQGSSQTGAVGNDVVNNTGVLWVGAQATARAGTAAAALGSAGSVSAEANANAEAHSSAIYTGGGDDQVTSTTTLLSGSSATAQAVSIGVAASQPAPTSADGESGSTSVSVKAGSSATAGNVTIDTDGTGTDSEESVDVSITRTGLELVRTRSSTSQAGDDTVENSGWISSGAEASSLTLAVSAQAGSKVDAVGSVSADATSTAEATNTAIYTGGGADQIRSTARIDSSADADAASLALSVSVSQPGAGSGTPPAEPSEEESAKTQATANADASATANGIDAGDQQSTELEDRLRIDDQGLLAHRLEVSTAEGSDDVIDNDGAVTAEARARAAAGAVAAGIQTDGTTAASTNSSARATSGALLAGAGSDQVTSNGTLTSTADAEAGAVSVAFSMSNEAGSRARAEANSTSDSRAVGISTTADSVHTEREATLQLTRDGIQIDLEDQKHADAGADSVANQGDIVANAAALSGTIAAGVGIDGSSSTEANASATSRADAIDTGGGADVVQNTGHLESGATSTSVAITASIGTAGTEKSGSKDEASASTTANADAAGIRADSGRDETGDASLTINDTGLHATAHYQTATASGEDTVQNFGRIDSTAVSQSYAVGAAVAIDGVAKAEVNSTANGRAVGIDTGGANDAVANRGVIVAETTATTAAVGVSVGANRSSGGRARVETNSTAAASSTGISTDGGISQQSIDGELTIDTSGITLDAHYSTSAAAGNDQLDNRAAVTSNATATSVSAGVSVSVKGASSATARSTAESDATALNAGAGADLVSNTGALNAHSDATAASVAVAVSNGGRATSNSGLLNAGTEATSRAYGIAAAGINATETLDLHEEIDFDDIGVTLRATHTVDGITADGVDAITNSGAIAVSSEATAPEVTAAVTSSGTALTLGRSTAESTATAIDTGNLGDTIDNTATLSADAEALAIAVQASVTGKGLAVAGNAVWDGGTEAQATSRGIDADGGERTTRVITAQADEDLARVRYSRETQSASGNDTVRNSGDITVGATSTAPTVSIAASAGSGAGAAVTVSTSAAGSDAIAIRGGDGDDSIDNDGTLISTADATAVTANVSLTNTGVAAAADAVWDGGTKANADATGIAGDGGERTHSRLVSVGTDGLLYDDDGVLADGVDTIDNGGDVHATATSTAASVSLAMTINGVGAATSTSTSTAQASAIDAGAGTAVDHVSNRGVLTADATATAVAVAVSVTNNGAALSADSVWDGGTKALTRARGIDVGSGGEAIVNDGAIGVNANSTTVAVSASVTASAGVAAATSTATGDANAIAIDASAGDDIDSVVNSGNLEAGATVTAVSASLSVANNGLAVASDAVWDGGTHATARSRGIDVGNANDAVNNTGTIDAAGEANAVSASFSATVNGVAGALSTSTANSDVAAIDTGAGDDAITSTARMSADAEATSISVAVALVMNGVAGAGNDTWDGGNESHARAAVIDAGTGADGITNSGALTSRAHSTSPAVSVALSVDGAALANSTATAASDASAIDAGDADDDIDNTGALIVDANSQALAVNVSLTGGGVAVAADSVWDGGTTAEAVAHGLRGGAGNDSIDNHAAGATINSGATATATSVSVSITGGGFAASTSTSTANAEGAAIDAGIGNDVIDNSATVRGSASANATSVSVSITGSGAAMAADAFWDGGTHATAGSSGIAAGAGNDTLTNLGNATAHSDSTTTSAAVAASLTGTGVSFASAASTSSSDATALNAGAGDDLVTNSAALRAETNSIADGLSVAFTANAVAVAGFDASTRANSSAIGIGGGDGVDTLTNDQGATITLAGRSQTRNLAAALTLTGAASANADAESVARGAGLDGGAGNDTLRNFGNVNGRVDAVASSLSVSGVLMGVNQASATSRSRAEGAALAGGDGNDLITNTGNVNLLFNAEASGQSIAASIAGMRLSDATAEAATDAAGQRGDAGADTLTNSGGITLHSTATTQAHGISVGAFGLSIASANSLANLNSAGLSGGADNDQIANAAGATIDVWDESFVNADSLSITISGGAGSEARAIAHSSSTGLSGGTGNDVMLNAGTVRVTVNNRANADSASIDVSGAASARAGVEVDSRARGVDAGDGDDLVLNTGTLVVGPGTTPGAVMAYLEATPDSVSITGSADAQAATLARTDSAGLDGAAGNDLLRNEGTLNVIANALTNASTGSLNIFGGSGGSGESGAFTRAAGLDGAAGSDNLQTVNTLNVNAASWLTQDSSTFTFGGNTSASGELVADTQALGLSGGDGNDTLAADGALSVTALSDLQSTGDSSAGFGSSGTVGQVGANTSVIGLDGGAGDDLIGSMATLTLNATSNLYMNSSSYTFGGNADNGASLAARTESHGIAGGDGADRIANGGSITIQALATLHSEGDSDTTFGGGSDFVVSGGVARATGLTGGAGDDLIENSAGATLNINATADVSTRSTSYTFIGSAPSSGASLTGEATVTGFSGDAGNDSLINHGTLSVHSDARLDSASTASTSGTATSSSHSTGLAVVDSTAKGFSGGIGDDLMGGTGAVTVNAEGTASAFNDANTGAFSIVNGNEAGAVTRATVDAIGFEGGSGDNRSEILGALNVTARSVSYALSNSAGADVSWDSSGKSSVDADARAYATAVTGGAGNDAVLANAPIDVTATATTLKPLIITLNLPTDIRSSTFGEVLEAPPVVAAVPAANAAGYDLLDVVFWHTLDTRYQDPHLPRNVQDEARGGYWQLRNIPDPNDGSRTIVAWVFLTDGLVQVRPVQIRLAEFPTFAAADGGGITGSGNAFANGSSFAEAKGFSLGAGDNSVVAEGSIDVTANADGVIFASADGDGWGNAYSYTTANASARAIGVETGDGNDTIRLLNDVNILARPRGQTRGEASGGDVCIWFFGWWCGGGGSGYAYATVNVSSEARGIDAGSGNNVIETGRTIDDVFSVVSRPEIRRDPDSGEFVTQLNQIDGGNVHVNASSSARGIDTGAGNNEITNRGVIKVEAYDLISACDGANCNGLPPQGPEDGFTNSVFASGITTGAGDDILRNYGRISSETIQGAWDATLSRNVITRTSTVAVDLGDGSDTLVLGDGSSIVGVVRLGAGDDTLSLFGTPGAITNSQGAELQVDAGAGVDTLILNGLGSYAGAPASIERAVKRDAGTFTLGSLSSNLQSIAVTAGTLRVNGNYTFAATGEYSTFFNVVNGASGVISFAGNTTLGGGIVIERHGDAFVANGRRWNVVHADGTVNGDFGDITLPDAKPLLRFELERNGHDVDVVSVAPSFATVTDNPLLQQIAGNLDGITGRSQSFVDLFGRLQDMDGDFDRAFKSFSPEAHLATSGSALTYSRELNQALRLHLGESRTRYRLGVDSATPEVAFSFNGGDGGLGNLQIGGVPVYAMNEMPQPPMAAPAAKARRGQVWMLGISARTDYDALDGFDAFESSTQGFVIGTDHRIGDEWLVGASIGAGDTEVDVSNLADGGIDSWQASLYATWFNDRWHLEGGASVGKQEFTNRRELVLDNEIGSASSAHSGKVWSAFLGGGTRLGDDRLMIEPYFSLNYFDSREDWFRESEAAGISQIVDSGIHAAMFGEAGFKFSALQKTANSVIDWHFNLGLSHDFEIDDADVTFTYTGAMGDAFTLDGRQGDPNSHLFGAGVTLMRKDSAFTLEYRGMQSDDHSEQYLGARVSLRF